MWSYLRDAVEVAVLCVIAFAQWRMAGAALDWAARRRSEVLANLVRFLVWAVGAGLIGAAVLMALGRHWIVGTLPLTPEARGWIRGAAYLWAFNSTGVYLIYRLWRWPLDHWVSPSFTPSRRRLLRAAGTAAMTAPVAVTGFGVFIQRTDFRVREVDVPIPNLPPDLEGWRLLQISDVHLGIFLSEREFARVIDAGRELRPHLVLATGDFISEPTDPLYSCLRQIARLRPEAGVFGCMGNHEAYASVEEGAAELGAGLGIRMLRREAQALKAGSATLNLVGVDHQSVKQRSNFLKGVAA
ncbi:MAG: metallophosphoesterase, partial [Acidobacteria bacterium]|nr:metallophosphoesterase [Acidobacteriota bacterium]